MAQELSDVELHRIDEFLSQVVGGAIPNTEALDGFFAALACCPDLVMPGEFLPVLQTGETEASDLLFGNEAEAKEFIELIMRHWSHVNAQLDSGEAFVPLMISDADGIVMGNDWAKVFLIGTHMRNDIWDEVYRDGERNSPLVPILALAWEHHSDPEVRPFIEPRDVELRKSLIIDAAAGVMRLYAIFLPMRRHFLPDSDTFVHVTSKNGRHTQCPCGSGKKFKKCCGAAPTFH